MARLRFRALRLLLTERCNISCAFCHNEGQLGTTSELVLSEEEFDRLARVGAELGVCQIKLSGGEPTLHPLILTYVGTARSHDLDVAIISNGHRSDVLEQACQLGARVSLNVPSADPDSYRRITRADMGPVTEALERLAKRKFDIAINSYAPPRPTKAHVTGLSELASRSSAKLKLLLPCQVVSPQHQAALIEAYESLLRQIGGEMLHSTPFDTTWRVNSFGVKVRIVRPWCPVACRRVAGWYQSIRIGADRRIQPCFSGYASDTAVLRTGSDEAVRAALERAFQRTASDDCAAGAGVQIVRRSGSSDTDGVRVQIPTRTVKV